MRFATPMILLMTLLPVAGQAPNPDDLLRTARYVATLQQQDLTGHIRKEGTKLPVGLFLRGEDIQFTYNKPRTNEAVRFHMRLEDDHYDLFEIENGKTRRFPEGKLGQSIEGTDLSYEDLAMRFLYWPRAIMEGSAKVDGQDCWQVRMINPTGEGRYSQVRVWVHKKSRALMQVVGYNKAGRPLKRFQVTAIMKVGSTYTLRQMRVDTIEPVANRVVGLTYLEFKKPKVVGPGGLD